MRKYNSPAVKSMPQPTISNWPLLARVNSRGTHVNSIEASNHGSTGRALAPPKVNLPISYQTPPNGLAPYIPESLSRFRNSSARGSGSGVLGKVAREFPPHRGLYYFGLIVHVAHEFNGQIIELARTLKEILTEFFVFIVSEKGMDLFISSRATFG